MKDEITGIMVITLGVFFFLKRDSMVSTLLKQKKFGEDKLGVPKYNFMSSESYFLKLIITSSVICIIVGILTFFGILHAK
jgi:hypothetical protein